MKLNKENIKAIVNMALLTREDEWDCETCYNHVHQFAEKELLGLSPDESMPLVKFHLDKCPECKEEYEALLIALKKLKAYK